MMVRREFGDAGRTFVIEEKLKGREVSVLALVEGRNIFDLEPCQDHKRLGDGDARDHSEKDRCNECVMLPSIQH